MKWSWKIATVAGIGIYVHWTFLLVIGWIIFVRLEEQADAAGVLEGVAFILTIFGCIVLHELGHALTAKRYGIQTRDITLLPIGGLARLERIPEDPVQEFWVAIAGPAVNVAIAAVLYVVLRATRGPLSLEASDLARPDFLLNLLQVNVFLVLFNLLPAFPMDGGRVLRAILAHFTGNYVGATQIAASIGQMMAILFGVLGLFTNPFLVFIALFVYLGAQEEAHMVQMRSLFRGLPVREAMMTQVRALSPDDTIGVATHELLAGASRIFRCSKGADSSVCCRAKCVQGAGRGGRDGTRARFDAERLPHGRGHRNARLHVPPHARAGLPDAGRHARWPVRGADHAGERGRADDDP